MRSLKIYSVIYFRHYNPYADPNSELFDPDNTNPDNPNYIDPDNPDGTNNP